MYLPVPGFEAMSFVFLGECVIHYTTVADDKDLVLQVICTSCGKVWQSFLIGLVVDSSTVPLVNPSP